jgi:hypothetical protein
MERSPMLMDCQNQYCENNYITKSNLHVPKAILNQNSNDITEIKSQLKIHLESQKTTMSNAGGHNTQLETILQSDSSKNFMVLAKKPTWNTN